MPLRVLSRVEKFFSGTLGQRRGFGLVHQLLYGRHGNALVPGAFHNLAAGYVGEHLADSMTPRPSSTYMGVICVGT
jgi:hypothetical protein